MCDVTEILGWLAYMLPLTFDDKVMIFSSEQINIGVGDSVVLTCVSSP